MKYSNLWHPDRAAPTDASSSPTKTGQDDGHKRAVWATSKAVVNQELGHFRTLRPEQNGHRFVDDTLKYINH